MLNYFLYRLGEEIALAFPLKLAYFIAVKISDFHYLFASSDKACVTENLKAIFPQKSEKEIKRIRLMMFRNFAKYLVDFFRFSKIDSAFIKKNVHIENRKYLDEAIEQKKGVILLTAHLGNWELGGTVIPEMGYRFSAVALKHKDKKVNLFFDQKRKSKGVNVIPFGKAVKQCLNVLNNNEVLALVGDRDFSERGTVVNFFGKPTMFPEGPAAFSIKTGASIVPSFFIRNRDNTFTLKFEKPIEVKRVSDNAEGRKEIIKDYKNIFEEYIRKYPDQWYMFRRFWLS